MIVWVAGKIARTRKRAHSHKARGATQGYLEDRPKKRINNITSARISETKKRFKYESTTILMAITAVVANSLRRRSNISADIKMPTSVTQMTRSTDLEFMPILSISGNTLLIIEGRSIPFPVATSSTIAILTKEENEAYARSLEDILLHI